MSFGKLMWAVLSVAMAYGINVQSRPEIKRAYERSEYASETGKLTLPIAGTQTDFPLITVHIVTVNVEHVGKTYAVREIMLRSPTIDGETPRFEMFAALPEADGVDYTIGFRDPTRLRGSTMLLKPTGRLGSSRSFFTLDGGEPRPVVGGTVVFSEVLPFANDSAHSGYRVEGKLDLEIDTENGVKILPGKLAARIVWDED